MSAVENVGCKMIENPMESNLLQILYKLKNTILIDSVSLLQYGGLSSKLKIYIYCLKNKCI